MKITNEVISNFWGNGNGFIVASIKRYGGSFATEDILEKAHYESMVLAILAKNKNKEFESELHMINYLMRLCYWSCCKVYREYQKLDQYIRPESDFNQESGQNPILNSVSTLTQDSSLFVESSLKHVKLKFGKQGVEIARLFLIEGHSIKEISDLLGIAYSNIYVKSEKIKRYLRFKMRTDSI